MGTSNSSQQARPGVVVGSWLLVLCGWAGYALHMICNHSLCRREFFPRQQGRRFCSRSCWYHYRTAQRAKAVCVRCGQEFVIKNSAYLRRGGARFCSKTCSARRVPVNEHYFDHVTSEAQAYWLGLVFSDGHNYRAATGLALSLHRSDGKLVEQFRDALGSGHALSKQKGQVALQVSSPPLSAALERLGCPRGKKSYIIRFPVIDPELTRHFIRGVFDGDGWMTARLQKTRPPYWTWGVYSKSGGFMEDIQNRLTLSGIRGSLSCGKSGGTTLKVVGRPVFPVLYEYLYDGATVWLPRKRTLVEQAAQQVRPLELNSTRLNGTP
jgi:hypothetical protein